jgi:hypothetical protein
VVIYKKLFEEADMKLNPLLAATAIVAIGMICAMVITNTQHDTYTSNIPGEGTFEQIAGYGTGESFRGGVTYVVVRESMTSGDNPEDALVVRPVSDPKAHLWIRKATHDFPVGTVFALPTKTIVAQR